MFHDYYSKSSFSDDSISMIDKREFGFLLFDGLMLRHKSFERCSELSKFLSDLVPSDAYLSCAYYERPRAEMDRKDWLGADLIFDIDADHIPTSCGKIHDSWVCSDCLFSGKGVTPKECPSCGSRKFKTKVWHCEECLESTKTETVKLLNMLTEDLGFSEKDVRVFFSGRRGYHVTVENKAVSTLDAVARKEIVDYVSGLGLDVAYHGITKRNLEGTLNSQAVPLSRYSWSKRLKTGIQTFILNAEEENLNEIGLKRNIAETILQNKDAILKNLVTRDAWNAVRGVGFKTWKKIAEHVAKLQSSKIDTVVTTDTHRLIRLVDTLHGKTGMKKVEFPISTIDSFDPLKSAIAFKTGVTTLFVHDAPEFRLGDEVYGPFENQKAELPLAAAMLLTCNGRAEVIEKNV